MVRILDLVMWTPAEMSDFLSHPSRWPYRPMLPMKLYLEEGAVTGYILEQQGLRIFDYDTRAPINEFASVEELVEAGWQVD